MKRFSNLLMILSLVVLSGCTWTWRDKPDTRFHRTHNTGLTGMGSGGTYSLFQAGAHYPFPVLGALVGTAVGQSETKIRHHLALMGGKVIDVGEHRRIILPVDLFFEVNTDELREEGLPLLDDLATLIRRRHGHCPVAITAYMDSIEHPHFARELSLHRAERIASYFWSQGVDQHYLYPVGLGGELPIAENRTLRGFLANRRIEISF